MKGRDRDDIWFIYISLLCKHQHHHHQPTRFPLVFPIPFKSDLHLILHSSIPYLTIPIYLFHSFHNSEEFHLYLPPLLSFQLIPSRSFQITKSQLHSTLTSQSHLIPVHFIPKPRHSKFQTPSQVNSIPIQSLSVSVTSKLQTKLELPTTVTK